MSWIRSEVGLPRHPKTLALKSMLNIEMDTLIGRLHFLWWWTLEYALDGDLSRKEPKVIEEACQVPLKLLIKSGFVDARPYRRIHDWWDNQGNYLKIRFQKYPEKWKRIEEMYTTTNTHGYTNGQPSGKPRGRRVDVDLISKRTFVPNERTDVDLISPREAASLGAPPPALTKVEADDMPDFDHEDFKKAGWINSQRPADTDSFGWAHFDRAMSEVERVQSKMREKYFSQKKHWN